MKYAVRITSEQGEVEYVSSTRYGNSSPDITDAALFVQQKSAIKAARDLHFSEVYPRTSAIDAVEIDFVVKSSVNVPALPKKTGFAIIRMVDEPVYDESGTQIGSVPCKEWFNGTKRKGEYEFSTINQFGNLSCATTFTSEKAAQLRIAEIQAAMQEWFVDERERASRASLKSDYYRVIQERRQLANSLRWRRQDIAKAKLLKVEAIE